MPGLSSFFLLLLGSLAAAQTFEQQCLAFKPESFVRNSTRTQLEFVTTNTTLEFPDNVASCGRPSQLVSTNLCRIAMSIPTSNRSSITFELWLPENWTDTRMISTGNGGIDGCIKYEDLAYTSANGFAAMGTNNGHNGTTGVTMLNNPDIIEDYAYRSLHTGTTVGKRLIEKFYGQKPSFSYYIGCSLGGRQGIKGAEMFPEDYDGIVAGCPAVDFLHLQGERALFFTITGAINSTNFINKDTWTGLIHNEVLNQCDEIDGVKDGIIEVADKCHFDPTPLLCPEGQDGPQSVCLNQNQTDQLRQIYAPYLYPDGKLLFPRLNPGNEDMAINLFFSGMPFPYSVDWFRYVVLNDSTWDPATYDIPLDNMAVRQNPFNIHTYPISLPAFSARGGKLLTYHGGQDNQITSFNTERFYDRMLEHDANLQDYYRFFRVSGMFHCSAGPGAWVLGQGGNGPSQGIPFSPEQNVLAAVVDWVENGNAPQAMLGTRFVNDTVSLGVDFQRSHCLYPTEQTYIGGDPKDPASWECEPGPLGAWR